MYQADSEGNIDPIEPPSSVEPLSPVEERVRQFLADRAADASPGQPFTALIPYGSLCHALDPTEQYWVGPRFRGIGQVLARVSRWEHARGRPMLSALVVQKATMRAGKGFAQLARALGEQVPPGRETDFWRTEVERVVAHWAGKDAEADGASDTEKARALLAKISVELAEVQRLLG
jgi:hypothetical protein